MKKKRRIDGDGAGGEKSGSDSDSGSSEEDSGEGQKEGKQKKKKLKISRVPRHLFLQSVSVCFSPFFLALSFFLSFP